VTVAMRKKGLTNYGEFRKTVLGNTTIL